MMHNAIICLDIVSMLTYIYTGCTLKKKTFFLRYGTFALTAHELRRFGSNRGFVYLKINILLSRYLGTIYFHE
jgi:hypothetical protein